MGLREKVALVIVAVIIQIANANTIKENPFERFVGRKQLKKSGVCYNSGSSQTNYNAPVSNPSNYNKVGYPGRSSYANSLAKPSSINNCRTKTASKYKFDPTLLEKFKKEARSKRKNKKHENATYKPTQSQDIKAFVFNTGAFPEVEYPLTAMDSWTSNYYNAMPYAAENYSATQNDLSQVTQTCRPVKSRNTNVCLKSAVTKVNKGTLSANNPSDIKNGAVNQNAKALNPNLSKNSKLEAQVNKNAQSSSANQNIVSGLNNPAKDRLTKRKLKKRLKSKHKNRKTILSNHLNKTNYISCTPKNDNINLNNLNFCSLSSNTTQDRSDTSPQLKLDSGRTPTDAIYESQIEKNRTNTILSNVSYDVKEMSPERVAKLNSLELKNLAEQVLAQIGPVPEEFNVPADCIIPLFVSGQMSNYRLPDVELSDLLKSFSKTQGKNEKDTDKSTLANLYKLVENVLAEINLKQNIPNDALVEIITKLDSLPTDYTLTDTFIPDKNIELDIITPTEYVLPNLMKMNYTMSEKLVDMPITNEEHDTIQNIRHLNESTEITINDSQNYLSPYCPLPTSNQCFVSDHQESNDNFTEIKLIQNIPNNVLVEIITKLYLLPNDYIPTDTFIPDKTIVLDKITPTEYVLPNVKKINYTTSEKFVEKPTNITYKEHDTLQKVPHTNDSTEITINDSQNYSLSFCPLPTSDRCSVDDFLDINDNFTASGPATLMEILNGSVSERIEEERESQEQSYKKVHSHLEEKPPADIYIMKQVQPLGCDVTKNTTLIELFSEDISDKLDNLKITDSNTVGEAPDFNKQDKQPDIKENVDLTPMVNSETEVFSKTLSIELKSSAIKDKSVISKDSSNNTDGDVEIESSQISKIIPLSVEYTEISDAEMKLSGEILGMRNNKTNFDVMDQLSIVEKVKTLEDSVPKLNDAKESTTTDKTKFSLDESSQAFISNSTAELLDGKDFIENVDFDNVAERSSPEITPDIEPIKSNDTLNIHDAKTSSENCDDESKGSYLTSNDTDTSDSILPTDDAVILETTSSESLSNSQDKDVKNSAEKSHEIKALVSEESLSEEDSYENESTTEFTTEKPEDNTSIKQPSNDLSTSNETSKSIELYVQGLPDDGVLAVSTENQTNSYDNTLVASDSVQPESTIHINMAKTTDANSQEQIEAYTVDVSTSPYSSMETCAPYDVKALSYDEFLTASTENESNFYVDTSVEFGAQPDKSFINMPESTNGNNEDQIKTHDIEVTISPVDSLEFCAPNTVQTHPNDGVLAAGTKNASNLCDGTSIDLNRAEPDTSFINMPDSTEANNEEKIKLLDMETPTSPASSLDSCAPNNVQTLANDKVLADICDDTSMDLNKAQPYTSFINMPDSTESNEEAQIKVPDIEVPTSPVNTIESYAPNAVKTLPNDVLAVSIENASNTCDDTSIDINETRRDTSFVNMPDLTEASNEGQIEISDFEVPTPPVNDTVLEEFVFGDDLIFGISDALPEITTINFPVYVFNEDFSEATSFEEPALYESDIETKTTPESNVNNSKP